MNYQLADAFEIDNHELDDLSPEVCFALGVEWTTFRSELLVTKDTFSSAVRAPNAKRLVKLCEHHNRRATVSNLSPGWVTITVSSEPILRLVP